MTPLENQQFLSFLTSQFDEGSKKVKLYQPSISTYGFEFFGTNNTHFIIRSIGNDVEVFLEDLMNRKILNTIMPLKQCIDFLDHIYKVFKKDKQDYLQYDKNSDLIKEQLDYVDQQLQLLPYQIITKDDKAYINIPTKSGLMHNLMIGMSFDLKEKKGLIDYIMIPLYIAQTKEEKNMHIFMLPTWHLHKYPCLKDFVDINNNSTTNIQELMSLLEQHSPELSKQFNYHILKIIVDNQVSHNLSDPKKLKI